MPKATYGGNVKTTVGASFNVSRVDKGISHILFGGGDPGRVYAYKQIGP